jgi:2-keto-4-pentenoate hydratase/2-oxohepta-3-ene-1,7-dioic acid hydratase in catechol pathway
MKLIRYLHKTQTPQYGWINEDQLVGPIEGDPFGVFRRLEAEISLSEVRLLAPVQPGKVLGIGRNYAAHAREHDHEVPEVPIVFSKPPSSIIGPEETIYLPPQSQQVEHEGELVVVFKKRGRWIAMDNVDGYILGYTLGNDVTARDLQRRDVEWTRSKGFDTFGPLGPWIETEFDPSDVMISCHVNGEMRQMASTRDMIFNIRQLVAFVSSVMTLEPGDVLFTGTPAGVGLLQPNDRVEVRMEGLGSLVNPVALEPGHAF